MKKSMMTTLSLATALTAFAGIVAPTASAQRDFSNVEITTQEVVPGIYMLKGAGGNIGLSVGDDGAFLIDDQFAPLSDKIIAAIKTITDQPIEFVLNTHHHGDHTGGNEAFGKGGAYIVAHDNVRTRLASGSSIPGRESPPVAPDALPVITFSQSVTFHQNGHELHIFHPENAHTDGDAIVFFKDVNVIHMGDVFFATRYPFIDTNSGGSIQGYIAALDSVVALSDEDTKIIPGHGDLSGKADVANLSATLKEISSRVEKLIKDGLDEEAVVAQKPLADLDEKWGGGFISGERMTRSVYKSLKGTDE